ncbi:MAG: hypothetical protein KDA96_21735 [Planctomycetaceae bacterium]|nr:hypothetical protein [Planctomycetaceae bacterium]
MKRSNVFRKTVILTVLVGAVFVAEPADAGILRTIWRSARDVAGKVMGEGAEAASRRGLRTAVRHTDDAGRLLIQQSDEVASFAAHFGDDAAMLAGKLDPAASRRLMTVACELNASGKAPEVLKLIAEGGKADQVIDFLCRNKGAIAGGAMLTALVTDPDAVLGAASDVTVGLAEVTGNTIAQPIIEKSMDHIVAPIFSLLIPLFLWPVFVALIVLLFVRRRTLAQDLREVGALVKRVRAQYGRTGSSVSRPTSE